MSPNDEASVEELFSQYIRKGIFFILTGPSGVGKTTVIKKLLREDPGLAYSVSHTTREKRAEEVEGEDYYFVSEEEFRKMRSRGDFLEWANVFGDYYGTSREELERVFRSEKDLILDLDVQGAEQIRERSLDRKAAYIFLAPPSKKELVDRFDSRDTESVEEREKRLEVADKELGEVGKFDYLVVNEDLEGTLQEVKAIIRAERRRILSGD